MEYIALIAAATKAAMEVMTYAQSLWEQHSQGATITEEQAQKLRDLVKAQQAAVEQAWMDA